MERPAAIVSQPADCTVVVNSNAVFTVEAVGAVSYRWQYRRSATGTWTETTMTGYNTDTLTVPATKARNGYQYRCIIKDAQGNTLTSDAATLTVVDAAAVVTGIEVTSLPNKTVYKQGENLNVAGMVVTVTYSDGTTSLIDDAFTLTGYDANTLGEQTVTVHHEGFTATFTVTVMQGIDIPIYNAAYIQQQPVDANAIAGETAEFTIEASFAQSYQWQYSKDSGQTWYDCDMPGYNTNTLTVTASETINNWLFRCVVTGQDGKDVASNTAFFTLANIWGIRFAQMPKTEYFLGEELDLSLLEIIAYYSNGIERNIGNAVEISGYNPQQEGVQTVTVHYDGVSTNFTVTVLRGGYLGDNLTWLLDDDGVLTISGEGAMVDFESYRTEKPWEAFISRIDHVFISSGVTYIGENAFHGYPITKLTLADSVTEIGMYAFHDCKQLSQIQWSQGLEHIDDYAFGEIAVTDLVLPEGLITIGSCAFSHCNNLHRVEIPSTVTQMHSNDMDVDWVEAFAWCENIGFFSVSQDNPKYSSDSNGFLYNKDKTVLYQAPAAWTGSYTVSDSVEKIMYPGFQDSKLTELILGENVKFVDSFAMRGCHELEIVRIPVGVEKVCDFLGLGSADGGVYKLTDVYYGGTAHQWKNVELGGTNAFKIVIEERLHTVAPQITHMSFYQTVQKLVYEYGEELDLTGLILKVLFHDDTYTEIIEGYTVTGYSANVVGTQTVTIGYEGFELTFDVEVLPQKQTAQITKQPEAVNANSGDAAVFSVETEGTVVSYQWQYRSIYKWFDTSMTGYNTNTLTVTATGARHGYDYRCAITFADGTVLYSEPAELTVNTVINITSNPNDQTVALGYKGQFTASATGEGLTYQWEYKRPNSEQWIDTAMEGANKPTVLIETTAARDGYQYRCRITDAAGFVAYTESATMRVLSVKNHPTEAFASTGNNAIFTVTTSVTENVSYQWQYRRNATANWTNTTMTGYNTATLTVGATLARNGYEYRCVLTGSKNSKIESKGAVLHVGNPVVINSQTEAVTVAAGEVATFTVDASNAYSYQWYYQRSATSTWFQTAADGNATATLNVTTKASNNGYRYRCEIKGLDGEIYYTEPATLIVTK